ncbi:MAG: ATP-grasp domain-containing protein [Candidatus Dormibacter sp.]
MRVLVAGIGGASLGTEILKCLKLAGGYEVFGCDISPYAFGHYQPGVAETFVVPEAGYVEAIAGLCRRLRIDAVIPGGEEPLRLLSGDLARWRRGGTRLAGNAPSVVAECSDKSRLFTRLAELGLPMPWSLTVVDAESFARRTDIPIPCVVKPAKGTGGSAFVTLATSLDEARSAVASLLQHGRTPLVQEYVAEDEGEYTVGSLATPAGDLVGTITLRRMFNARLSVLMRSQAGLISSGYSQGLIDEFPEVRVQVERIARAMHNAGPMNVQGRMRAGTFYPFEINPRFSATVFLRALAGFNEVDLFLKSLMGATPAVGAIRPGYYLRSLSEVYVPTTDIKRADAPDRLTA